MRVRLAGTARVLARSAGAVTRREWLGEGWIPALGGLLDETIFGPYRPLRCGCRNAPRDLRFGKPCAACGGAAEFAHQPLGPFGHVALPEPVLHPLAREPLARIVDLPVAEVTAIALGHKLLVHEGARAELIDAKAFDVLERVEPALRALDTADALLRLIEERGAERAAQLQLGRLGIQDLFLLAVPVLPSALRHLHAPFHSVDTFHNQILFHAERHALAANLPPEFKRKSRAAIARAVFGLFDNEHRPDPLRATGREPERSLCGHLQALARGPLSFAFERGEQSLELESGPEARALVEGLALEILPDARFSQN